MPTKRKNPINVTIGARIRQERESWSMTLEDLAKEIGLTLQMVAHYEAGRTELYVTRLMKIAKVFKRSPCYFLKDL